MRDNANCSIGTVTNILHCCYVCGQSTNPFGQSGGTPLLNTGDLMIGSNQRQQVLAVISRDSELKLLSRCLGQDIRTANRQGRLDQI